MLPDECNPGSVDIVQVTGSRVFDSSDVLGSILRPAELEMDMYVLFGKLMECIECMVTTGWRGVAEEQWRPRDLSILPHLDSSTYVLIHWASMVMIFNQPTTPCSLCVSLSITCSSHKLTTTDGYTLSPSHVNMSRVNIHESTTTSPPETSQKWASLMGLIA